MRQRRLSQELCTKALFFWHFGARLQRMTCSVEPDAVRALMIGYIHIFIHCRSKGNEPAVVIHAPMALKTHTASSRKCPRYALCLNSCSLLLSGQLVNLWQVSSFNLAAVAFVVPVPS